MQRMIPHDIDRLADIRHQIAQLTREAQAIRLRLEQGEITASGDFYQAKWRKQLILLRKSTGQSQPDEVVSEFDTKSVHNWVGD